MKGDGGLKRKMKADGDGDAPLHKHDEEDRGHERAGVLHEEDGAGVGHGVDDELQAAGEERRVQEGESTTFP